MENLCKVLVKIKVIKVNTEERQLSQDPWLLKAEDWVGVECKVWAVKYTGYSIEKRGRKGENFHVCISKEQIFNIFTNRIQVLVGKLSVFVMCE